jgi:hypothetical protein
MYVDEEDDEWISNLHDANQHPKMEMLVACAIL